MANQWFYSVDGKVHGPVASASLRLLAQQGRLAPHDWVRCEEMETWLQAQRVGGMFDLDACGKAVPPPPPPARPPQAPSEEAPSAVSPSIVIQTDRRAEPEAAEESPAPVRTAKQQQRILAWRVLGAIAGVAFVAAAGVWIVAWCGGTEADDAPNRSESTAAEPASASASKPIKNPPAPKAAEPLRATAPEEPIELDDLVIEVLAVALSRPRFLTHADQRRRRPMRQYLVIDLEMVRNDAAEGPLNYLGWGRPIPENRDVRLTDDRSRRYAPPVWPGTIEGQQAETQAVAPGAIVRDRLVFEAPDDSARNLTLRLPTSVLTRPEGDASEPPDREEKPEDDPLRFLDEMNRGPRPEYLLFEIPMTAVTPDA